MRLLSPLVVVLAGTVLLGGCAEQATPGQSPTASRAPAPTPSETPDDDGSEDVRAEIERQVEAYWAATVQAQRGNPDRGLFNGVAGPELTEQEVKTATDYQGWGIVREGAPSISDLTIESLGEDEALALQCVDHTEWVVPEAAEDDLGAVPTALRLERHDGTWLVIEYVEAPEELTC